MLIPLQTGSLFKQMEDTHRQTSNNEKVPPPVPSAFLSAVVLALPLLPAMTASLTLTFDCLVLALRVNTRFGLPSARSQSIQEMKEKFEQENATTRSAVSTT